MFEIVMPRGRCTITYGFLTRKDASSLAQSARAVIHSVYAESYVVIELGASSASDSLPE